MRQRILLALVFALIFAIPDPTLAQYGLTVGTSTKSQALDRHGPPAKREVIEGDEFWYYISREVNEWARLGHALQGMGAGIQGRPNPLPPPPVQTRIVIFRFDGQTGVLKSVHNQ